MGDEASPPSNSRREFLKSASLLALSGCAAPVTALASTTSIPRATAPTDLLEEFGYGAVQLAPGLARSQFEHTQDVMLRMNIDSLLKPYRLRAGLPAPGPQMGGWYDPEVVALMRGPQVLFALAQEPKLGRSQVMNVKRAADGYWQAGGVRFAPFTAVRDAPYSAYIRLA